MSATSSISSIGPRCKAATVGVHRSALAGAVRTSVTLLDPGAAHELRQCRAGRKILLLDCSFVSECASESRVPVEKNEWEGSNDFRVQGSVHAILSGSDAVQYEWAGRGPGERGIGPSRFTGLTHDASQRVAEKAKQTLATPSTAQRRPKDPSATEFGPPDPSASQAAASETRMTVPEPPQDQTSS